MELTQKLKNRAHKLKSDISALYLALKRKDTPLLAKAVIAITICYALSPIDLIPDFIPVLGFLDDVLLLPLLIVIAIKLIPAQILIECREQANDIWKNGSPKKFWYALPIIVIWVIVIAVIIKFLMLD
ncbi:hypothetical protein FACS1894127_3120 [Clostridia bacterium]|nr:hypothetical protein FACS1894127_3120 [Clostridia bacterium]